MHLPSTQFPTTTKSGEEDAETGDFDGEDCGGGDWREVHRVEVVERRFKKFGIGCGGVDCHGDGSGTACSESGLLAKEQEASLGRPEQPRLIWPAKAPTEGECDLIDRCASALDVLRGG